MNRISGCIRRFNHSVSLLAIALAAVCLTGCGANPNWSEEEQKVIEALRDIAQAQVAFQKGCYLDTDYDGIGDYGTLDMLADPDGYRGVPPLMNLLYTTERVGQYELYVKLVPGEGEAVPPYWECQAFTSNKKLHCFFVDSTGIIRFDDRRETANATSPAVEEPSTDA